jgi:hypothetical protein
MPVTTKAVTDGVWMGAQNGGEMGDGVWHRGSHALALQLSYSLVESVHHHHCHLSPISLLLQISRAMEV